MKVFLCEDIHQDALALLKKNYEVIDDLSRLNEVDALINRNLQMNQQFLDQCSNLKVVAMHGTGIDNIDLAYAKSKGITVFNVPGENALSVAEMNVAFALNLLKKVYVADRKFQRNEKIELGSEIFSGHELSYKNAGFIGYGNIAKNTINILKYGFHNECYVYSPSLTLESANEAGIHYCKCKEDVFRQSDIIFICCALNDATRGSITKDIMKHAKKDALFINTARGAVINETDLYECLKEGIFKGAACDVFIEEPPQNDHPLLTLDNFIATPHIAATTDEALRRVGMKAVQGIIDYFDGKELVNKK